MSDEVKEFTENAKFKTSGTGRFILFNPNEQTQIRIWKPEKTPLGRRYQVTLHNLSEDGITYDTQTVNITCSSLKEAKREAAKLYFKAIRN